jgi:hypothetical protein
LGSNFSYFSFEIFFSFLVLRKKEFEDKEMLVTALLFAFCLLAFSK